MKMKLVNHGLPKDEELGVVEQKMTFIQNSDTWDSDRFQYANFETRAVDFSAEDNTDSFIRFSIGDMSVYNEKKTDIAPFWSCEGPEEIVEMFNEFAKRSGMSCRWKIEKYHVRPITEIAVEEIVEEKIS